MCQQQRYFMSTLRIINVFLSLNGPLSVQSKSGLNSSFQIWILFYCTYLVIPRPKYVFFSSSFSYFWYLVGLLERGYGRIIDVKTKGSATILGTCCFLSLSPIHKTQKCLFNESCLKIILHLTMFPCWNLFQIFATCFTKTHGERVLKSRPNS